MQSYLQYIFLYDINQLLQAVPALLGALEAPDPLEALAEDVLSSIMNCGSHPGSQIQSSTETHDSSLAW